MSKTIDLDVLKQDIKDWKALVKKEKEIQKQKKALKSKIMKYVPAGNTVSVGKASVYWQYGTSRRLTFERARRFLSEEMVERIASTGSKLMFKVE